MKPVCDHPSYCKKNDAQSIYLGQTSHLSYPPHRNNNNYLPSGFAAIRGRWNGLCSYTGNANGNSVLCNVPSNSHSWRSPGQYNPGFICAKVGGSLGGAGSEPRTCLANGKWSGSAPKANPFRLPNGKCLAAGTKVWNSGAKPNKNGNRFILYLMPATSGFQSNTNGANKYKAICSAAGLHTVVSGYSSYSNNCRRWGCMPVISDGSWGSSSDVDDQVASHTGWTGKSTPLLIHAYNNGYPYVYGRGTSVSSGSQYRAVCGKPIVYPLPAGTQKWSSGSKTNRRGHRFILYLMPPTTGFQPNTNGANKYKAICGAVGLRTVGTGYRSYYTRCNRWGCMPLVASGWGSSSDVDEAIARNTGWTSKSTPLLMHWYSNGYPAVYGRDTRISSGQQYRAVCAREL